jgi:ubiquinone/menaquinone biosynthesis C-methylase UbiE
VPTVHEWEAGLVEQLTTRSGDFSPYPDYFRSRWNELRVIRSLLPHLFGPGQHERGLEVGCGYGFQTILLSTSCQHLTGIDIPVEYDGYVPAGKGTSVELARALAAELEVGNVDFAHAWPDAVEADDGAFDFLFSAYVVEHIPDLEAAMREWARIVRPGGVMVHVVPAVEDSLYTLAQVNVRPPWRSLAAGLLRRRPNRPVLRSNGTIVPPAHSEFVTSFEQQVEVYQLERTLHPAVEAGFSVETVTQSRSWNRVIAFRRLT